MLKRILLLGLVCLLGFGASGALAIGQYDAWIYSQHESEVFLGANGADFNTAVFDSIWIDPGFDTTKLTEVQIAYLRANVLSLLLKNSEYVVRSWSGFQETVSPARDSTLPLKFRSIDGDTLTQSIFIGEKSPNADFAGSFYGISEQGMKGKEISFTFDSVTFKKTLNYKTTAEQLASIVPSIELKKTGNNITGVNVKIVSKDAPNTPLSNATLNPRVNGIWTVEVTWETRNFGWPSEKSTHFVCSGDETWHNFGDDEILSVDYAPAQAGLQIPADALVRVWLTFGMREDYDTTRTWRFYPKLKEAIYPGATISYFIETDENFQPLAKPKRAPDEEGRRVMYMWGMGYKEFSKLDVAFKPAIKPITSNIRSEKGFIIGDPINNATLTNAYADAVNRFNTNYESAGMNISPSDAGFAVTMDGRETSVLMGSFLKYANNTFSPRVKVTFDESDKTLSKIEWYYTNAAGTARLPLPQNANSVRVELYATVHGEKQRYRLDRVYFNADTLSYNYDFKRSEFDNRIRVDKSGWVALETKDLPKITKDNLIYVMPTAMLEPETGKGAEYRTRYSYFFYPGYGSGITPVSADVVPGVAEIGFNAMDLKNYSTLPDKKVVSEDEIQAGRKMEDKTKDEDVKSNLKNNVKAELVKAVTFSVPYTGDPAKAGKYVLPTTLTFEAVSGDFKASVWEKIAKATDLETVLKNVHVYKILHDNTGSKVLVLDLVEIAGKDAEKIFSYQRDGDKIFISVNVLINDAAPKGHDGVVKPDDGSTGKAYILIRDGIEDSKFTDPMALGAPEGGDPDDPTKKSSGGCSTGYVPFALLLAAPLFFRKKK